MWWSFLLDGGLLVGLVLWLGTGFVSLELLHCLLLVANGGRETRREQREEVGHHRERMSLSPLNQTGSIWGSLASSGGLGSRTMGRAAATTAAAALQYVTANISGSLAMGGSQRGPSAGISTIGYDDFTDDGSVVFSQEQWSSGNNTTGTTAEDDFVLPYSYPEMVLIAIVAGFLSLLTVAGNCMVMISFKIDKQLQTISNYFLFSLAVADFAIGLISMPLFTVYILAGRWQLGPYVCDTWLSLDYLASNASVLNLLIISFDRYWQSLTSSYSHLLPIRREIRPCQRYFTPGAKSTRPPASSTEFDIRLFQLALHRNFSLPTFLFVSSSSLLPPCSRV